MTEGASNTSVISVAEWVRQHRELAEEAYPRMITAMRLSAFQSLGLVRASTVLAPPANPAGVGIGAVWTGRYLHSWLVELTETGASLFNPQPYAVRIELGQPPGVRTSPNTLLLWVQTKLGFRGWLSKRIAYYVARAIERRGLLPRNVMLSQYPVMVQIAERNVERALDAMLQGGGSGGDGGENGLSEQIFDSLVNDEPTTEGYVGE